jgi:hypothetical protein
MARDRKDRSSTWYMEHHGGALLRLAQVSGVVRWQAAQNVLGYPKQMPDGLLDVTFAGKATPDPFLIEIETYPDQETMEQLRRDLAMVILTRRVVPDILVVVLRPKGNLRIDPDQIVASAHRLTEFRLKVRVVNLWTVPAADLLAAGDVGLVPWVPLAQFDGSPQEMLLECREQIESRARPEEVGNLLAVTRVMAEARYNDVDLLGLLGGPIMSFEKVLLETPAGKRFLAKKAKETERTSARKYIRSLLRERFGDVPGELTLKLRAIENQKKLDDLLKLAAMCPDLETFRAALEKA